MIRKFIDSDYHSWYSVHMKIIITLIKEDGVCNGNDFYWGNSCRLWIINEACVKECKQTTSYSIK